jgi:D-amino-acid dehydrogenase
VGGEHLIRREGQLQLYEGEAEFKASLAGWETRKKYGVIFELLETPDAIASIQPGIDSRFTHAGYTPDWVNVVHPATWTQFLADAFVNLGGAISVASVESLEVTNRGVELHVGQGSYRSDQVVLAAGAWSKKLAQSLGDNLPLDTERGYNTTLPEGAFDLKTHLTFSNHGFVVSKAGEGVRVGGAVELGGLKLKPNYHRASVLLSKAANLLPTLNTQGGQQWMGFRPSMPDSLPVISYSTQSTRVIYAFGHGHLGLTQSSGTAELVCELLLAKEASIPMAPYSATRFQ